MMLECRFRGATTLTRNVSRRRRARPVRRRPSARFDPLPVEEADTEEADTLGCRGPRRARLITPPIFPPDILLAGSYRVGSVLGTGGMSQVLEARDLRLDRTVAVKACKPGVSSRHLVEEGKLLGSFCHPSIVAVYDIGNHEGIDFLVIERLYGFSLREHLDRLGDGLSIPEALDLLLSLCDALAVIHRAGVMHRDLKPSNIMLTPGNRPVLFDLGVSLRQEQWQHSRDMAGSPHYIAPESIASAAHDSHGCLVDIYSLGCIAYELFTGQVPFPGHDTEAVLTQHLHRPTPRISDVVAVPAPLDRLVAEMMSKEPEERPQSVEVVSAWLRGIRRGQAEPVAAPALDVLIADDDEDMRALLGSFVEQSVPGARVRLAADGEYALRELRRAPPDLLLLDLDMPRLSGLELCMLLRGTSRAARTAITAISGTARDGDRELLLRLGVTEFISKRESIGELLGRLRAKLRDCARMRSRVLGHDDSPGSVSHDEMEATRPRACQVAGGH